MKKFVAKISLLLLIPLAICLIIFLLFEPNNYFGIQNYKGYKGSPIYRIREDLRNNKHKDILILGDSRFAHFDRSEVEKLPQDQNIRNLAFGGSSLRESIDMFWWAVNQDAPQMVIFGTSFYNLNEKYTLDRLQGLLKTAQNPIEYITSLEYIKNTFSNIKEFFNPTPFHKDLDGYAKIINGVCTDYVTNVSQLDELKKIIDYCNKNNIYIVFALPPIHQSIWDNVISDLKLEDELSYYKNYLNTYAAVYDMETPHSMYTTSYGDDFLDGFHIDTNSDAYLIYKKDVYALIDDFYQNKK